MTKALEAINYLSSVPSKADDYVEYIKFVDKAQQSVDTMESQLDYIKEIYDIMEEYKIPVDDKDVDNYLVEKMNIFLINKLEYLFD